MKVSDISVPMALQDNDDDRATEIWKILRRQIWEKNYDSLLNRGLFLEEQKECHKGTRGIGDLLYIDQYIVKESKTRRKM